MGIKLAEQELTVSLLITTLNLLPQLHSGALEKKVSIVRYNS
jgi:hypothetical protein